VVLATLDVPFAHGAIVFAVDSAVEAGQPLVIVNVAEIVPTHWSLVGYGYMKGDAKLGAYLNGFTTKLQSPNVDIQGLDINASGLPGTILDMIDFNAIATNFNQPLPGALPASSRGGLVPDPSGAIVLAAITFVARQQAARLHGHNR